jgi:DNA-binding winged helix-turn-helix (wHTH) protein
MHLYEFGPYAIDPAKPLLLCGEGSVLLPSKVFETLLVLVQHSEEVVSKDDLLKTVWPDSFVEESNLSQSIFLLRKVLGETAQDHRYIVTIPGWGYRFAESVRLVAADEADLISVPL